MRKITYDRYGGVDVLKLADVPVLTVDKDKLLIRVKAAAINPLDWNIMAGKLKTVTGSSFPKGVGIDFSGIVEQVGDAVETYRKGDEVFGIVAVFKGGAPADYVVVSAEAIARKPATLSFEQAAALPVGGLSAIQIFDKLAPLQPGMAVLINGATGGIGMFATQLAKRYGTEVTAVVGSKGLEQAKKWGSDFVIDYERENVLNAGKLYDVILDFSDKLPFDQAEKIMQLQSVYVNTMPDPVQIFRSFIHNLFSKKKSKILSLTPTQDYLQALDRYAADGLDVVVSTTYPMTSFKQAYTDVPKGGILGKAVITM